MDQHIVVPVVLFACVTYAFRAVLDAVLRERLLRAGAAADLVQVIVRGEERQRRAASLRWGLIFTALAAGFAIVQALGWQELTAGAVAVLAAALGIGHLAFFGISQRLDL